MKGPFSFLIVTALLLAGFTSCKKDSPVSSASTITLMENSDQNIISPYVPVVGEWRLLKDSLYVVGAPPFFRTSDSVYFGEAADYYNFKGDGSLLIKERNQFDTLAYELLPNNQVNFIYNYYITVADSLSNIISRTKYKKTFTITTLTQTNLTMSTDLSSDILGPEGYFAERLKLAK
jgi:hypothetical protein